MQHIIRLQNKAKFGLISLTALFAAINLFLTLTLTVPAAASSRSIKRVVRAHTLEGAAREIELYSGYHALVIGCAAYNNGWEPLPNPVKDARKVAAALKKIGFTVKLIKNPDAAALRLALNGLVSGAGEDVHRAILVYFAGHGHTLTKADGKKLGYIVPADAPDPDKDKAGFINRAMSMRDIEEISMLIPARHVLMAFDSCFSGSVFRAARGKPSKYIREQIAYPVRAFITAGNEDEKVSDDSVFKTCFIQGLTDRYADLNKDGYVTGQELGLYLREEVVNYTDGAQHPKYGKIKNPELDKGDFVFLASS
ncbi:MAG: caspase family protein, partial [Gammaproteobacteria bacterium]|nr:caspase family protein [Gammaproteobacteria bacterium]